MAEDRPAPPGVGGKRRRDATGYVVMRRPRPMVVGRASQADADAEAFARFVGSWGNFSAPLGQRWEALAGEYARGLLGRELGPDDAPYTLRHVEELDRDEALHREIERVGVSCPDALFCGRDAAGRVVVQPVDYKMSLDTAGFDQVEAERILDLATRGGDLTVAAIWSALAGEGSAPADAEARRADLLARLEGGSIRPVDGLFVSPDTAFNRGHLRSPANRQRQRPLGPVDVLLVAATPEHAFGGLPGWPEAQVLLQADRVRADLPGDLGMAERYARLGAGVEGALRTIHMPLFGPPPPLDAVAELRRLLAEHPSSLDVLRHLQERRAARLELLRRRDALLRFPFRMAFLLEALGAAPAAAGWPDDLLRAGIAELHALHRQRVAEAGLARLAPGLDDAAVLERLEEEWPAFKRAARADIQRWARGARAGGAPLSPAAGC